MSSKSPSTRQSKKPLHHLKSKRWCFPPSPTPHSPTHGSATHSSPPKSPEPNCAICLGKIEDKSFTDRCFHCFCRLCLFEWAKVKAECPVCRQAFEKIIFNIRAMDDYDEHVVQTAHRHRFGGFGPPFPFPLLNLDANPRFRYPTTMTPMRRRLDLERRFQMRIHDQWAGHDYYPVSTFNQFMNFIDNRRAREQRVPSSRRNTALSHSIFNNNNSLRNSSTTPMELRSSPRSSISNENRFGFQEDPMVSGHSSRGVQWSPYHRISPTHFELDIFPPPPGTSAHRRYIYDSELYVMTNGDGNTSRTREVSARFFSSNPACTHRLIPWLNRELNAILDNTNETETLIPRIMNALLMYDITSVGFKKIIAPFTLNKTDHFIHEFYNFARSPYDIEQYTRISVYVPKHRANIVESEPLTQPIGFNVEPLSPNRSSPDSISSSGSSIEILDPEVSVRMQPSPRPPSRELPSVSPTLSMHVYSIDGSDTEDSTEIRQLLTPSPVNTPSLPVTETVSNNEVSSASNPTPLPRGDLPDVNFGNIDIIDDFDNPKPGTSGISQRMPTLAQTKWSDSETTDLDVGQELEAAIARFENNGKTEVKKEENEITNVENKSDGNESESSCSSVLIVGYVKPLHERTPEFVDLISSEDEIKNEEESETHKRCKKSKNEKRDKHRKRSKVRSRSPSSIDTHSKKKYKHKCRDRSRDKHRHRHRHRRRYFRSHSSTSSDTSSSDDEMRQFVKKCRKGGFDGHHRRHSYMFPKNNVNDSKESDSISRPLIDNKTVSSFTPSGSRSLGSVVIPKQMPQTNQQFRRHFYIYSDSE